jgi:hypothetical protein
MKLFYSIDLLIFLVLIILVSSRAYAAPIKIKTKASIDLLAPQKNARQGQIDSDRIELPASTVKFLSPNGSYQFFVTTADNWASKTGQGKLIKSTVKKYKVVWKGALPQEYGPRYVLVGLRGEVLMLDEWINVKSKYAITIVNPDLDRVVHYNFDEIQQVLQVPASVMVKQASQGSWWISAPPRLDKSGLIAYVNTAGKVLQINLVEGKILLLKTSPTEL